MVASEASGTVDMQSTCRTFRWCNVFRIFRRDGVIIRLTDHSRILTFEGGTFSPLSLAVVSAERREVGLKESDMELVGYIDETVTADDVRSRLFNGAKIQHRIIDWRSGRVHYASTRWIQQMQDDGLRWHAALTGKTNKLQEPVGGRFGGVFRATCGYRLGSVDKCKAAVIPVTGDDYTGVSTGSNGYDNFNDTGATFPTGTALRGAYIFIGPRRATGTVTIAAGNAADTNTVAIVDANGLTITFEFDNNATYTAGRHPVTIGAANTDSATNLAAAINANTELHCTAIAASNVVTVTQQHGGTAGNSVITVSGANLSKANFSGGATSTGEGQTRKIIYASSSTRLILDTTWDAVPAASDPYSIGFGATVLTVNNASRDVEFDPATVPEWFRQTKLGFDDWFALGEAEWTVGDNVGTISPIQTYEHSARGVTLTFDAPSPIQVGDRAILRPGCDGLRGTCIGKFAPAATPTVMSNMLNFGGSPLDEAGGDVLEPPSGEPLR